MFGKRQQNKLLPTVCGIGIVGIGEYTCTKEGVVTVEYHTWRDMLKRCYLNNKSGDLPSYLGCYVNKEWHNFQNFAAWYTSHKNYGKGYQLDKDLTILGNREYCSDNCYLVPPQINSLIKTNTRNVELPCGVSYDKSSGKYKAYVSISGKNKMLGRYDSIDDAFSAYKEAKQVEIIRVANLYRGEISEEIYNNLLNYYKR